MSHDLNQALETVRRAGFAVTSPRAGEWIAPADLWFVTPGTGTKARFLDRRHHPRCPHYQRKVGPSGRLLLLRPTPALLAWLRAPSQPGRRMT